MSSGTTQKLVFAKKPVGHPTNETFELKDIPTPTVTDGKIIVKLLYISVDPYLRNRIDQMPEGSDMVSGVVGEVIESKNDSYVVGTRVWFYGHWQRIQLVDPAAIN